MARFTGKTNLIEDRQIKAGETFSKSIDRAKKVVKIYVPKGTDLTQKLRDKYQRWYPNYAIHFIGVN